MRRLGEETRCCGQRCCVIDWYYEWDCAGTQDLKARGEEKPGLRLASHRISYLCIIRMRTNWTDPLHGLGRLHPSKLVPTTFAFYPYTDS